MTMKMRASTRDDSNSAGSSINNKLAEAASKEFFWGCELTTDSPTVQWNFDEEEDDQDFLEHTLFLRHAILGKGARDNERNIVEIETKNFAGDEVKQPILSLTAGKSDMCQLDLNFGHEIAVTFRLVEGSGPVFLSAQQLVEFPQELEDQEEFMTDVDYTEDEHEGDEIEDVEDVEDLKGKKRKANGTTVGAKKKKGKLDSDVNGSDEDEDEDDEDEEDEENEEEMETSEEDMEEEDDEEEEDSEEEEVPKKKGKGKKGKNTAPTSAKTTKKQKALQTKKPKKGKSK